MDEITESDSVDKQVEDLLHLASAELKKKASEAIAMLMYGKYMIFVDDIRFDSKLIIDYTVFPDCPEDEYVNIEREIRRVMCI